VASEQEQLTKIQSAIERTKDQSPKDQAEAVAEYMMTEPSQATANVLWSWLVKGLIIMIGVALIGLVVLTLKGKSTDVVLTAFTTMVSGLLGLFVNPSSGGS
jgi:hypothetical protein